MFPDASVHCQPRLGSRPSSAELFTSHISQMAFLTAPQLNSLLVHPLPQETALILFRGIAEAFHLPKSSSQQQLQTTARVQNEEMPEHSQTADDGTREWQGSSAHTRIFQENYNLLCFSITLSEKQSYK